MKISVLLRHNKVIRPFYASRTVFNHWSRVLFLLGATQIFEKMSKSHKMSFTAEQRARYLASNVDVVTAP